MFDLYLGLTIIGILSVIGFWTALVTSHRVPRWVSDLLAVALVLGIFCYIRFLWHDVRLVRWLPFSSLVVVGNWFPIGAGMLSGLAWNRVPGSHYRKAFSVAALASVAGYSAVLPLLGAAPRCNNWWDGDQRCVQSTMKTCSPACAASLLAAYGIETTEQEMADLCLTREGTTWVGLYRGLKLKTAGTPYNVEVVRCEADELLATNQPAILSVGLDASSATREMQVEWGWIPGVNHTVLFLERNSAVGMVVVDPAPGYGQEFWTRDDLSTLFRGIAIRLVERS